ncbi:TetR/AcrR family transcriptional regulator [Streptomyces sp. NBC_01340]|uniref:TetR/AcrR family transcriptional regulator n=1 Tax=unclassified Streptomyces TaxID=2593676 RepID=UPI00224E4D40|nr:MULTISPECIES: TetR/AcrR family transcriptional regulator [unclassified Streptomyces]MCX4459817.1 TetR/AcrR family transcriptional regulator [Streptomyces sp. NBC_01719]MCX4499175.1 TetR/AcrR family transcriptional regulator [Streptomyces sp. NBC_01728]WSI43587.1 TetR/AcrR family transcriptional regulator [Streptomyces sp. NBC_01340]
MTDARNDLDVTTERADAARNRARLLEAAARLVAKRGAEHVTMHEVAEAAGVGKGTLFRRFGDRDGLLLALLGEAEAEFYEAFTSGPPPLGPGAPARDRLAAFGLVLIERIATDADLGAALGRQVLHERRHASDTGRAFHHHVSALLRVAGVDGDHDMLAHALLAFVDFETADYLHKECEVPVARLQATWVDLVRRVTRADGQCPASSRRA